MQIEAAAEIDWTKEKKQNESSFSDQMKAYMKHQLFLHCLQCWEQF